MVSATHVGNIVRTVMTVSTNNHVAWTALMPWKIVATGVITRALTVHNWTAVLSWTRVWS
jgi:hypothetical protein